MYLIIDACLSGSGIRDYYQGGYISPECLPLSIKTIKRLNDWLVNYHNEHFNGFKNLQLIDELDEEGKTIASLIKNELLEAKVSYFSDAKMSQIVI